MANKKYKVLSPLRHDGKSYKPGSYISLDEPGADWLISFGILKDTEASSKNKDDETSSKKKDGK